MSTTYSAFFSSGLLAHHIQYNCPSDDSDIDYDPTSSPSSPIQTPFKFTQPDTEMTSTRRDRNGTPTPETYSSQAPVPAPATPTQRLRRRRSSLAVGSNPMDAIRSPMRTATAALQLQVHLSQPSMMSRMRSGSISAGPFSTSNNSLPIVNPPSSSTGRNRSGSLTAVLRPRRFIRRGPSAPLPALHAPPPSVPLPEVPAVPAAAPPVFQLSRLIKEQAASRRTPLTYRTEGVQGADKNGVVKRDRAYSVDNGYFIDEEMKEN